ncbi:unnamed protein product [Closterium sp. Yama58-4]|nr:unnamed protein product [Closterium sp. Yama58-4]
MTDATSHGCCRQKGGGAANVGEGESGRARGRAAAVRDAVRAHRAGSAAAGGGEKQRARSIHKLLGYCSNAADQEPSAAAMGGAGVGGAGSGGAGMVCDGALGNDLPLFNHYKDTPLNVHTPQRAPPSTCTPLNVHTPQRAQQGRAPHLSRCAPLTPQGAPRPSSPSPS